MHFDAHADLRKRVDGVGIGGIERNAAAGRTIATGQKVAVAIARVRMEPVRPIRIEPDPVIEEDFAVFTPREISIFLIDRVATDCGGIVAVVGLVPTHRAPIGRQEGVTFIEGDTLAGAVDVDPTLTAGSISADPTVDREVTTVCPTGQIAI